MHTLFTLVASIVIIASLFAILWPRTTWYVKEGWKYKNLEPSDLALTMIRVGGVLGIIVGILIIFFVQSMFRHVPVGFPW